MPPRERWRSPTTRARAGAVSGRRWEAPPGVQPADVGAAAARRSPVEELHLCTVAVALAAADACARGAGVTPELKWPNDLMVRGAQARRHPGRGGPGLPPVPTAASPGRVRRPGRRWWWGWGSTSGGRLPTRAAPADGRPGAESRARTTVCGARPRRSGARPASSPIRSPFSSSCSPSSRRRLVDLGDRDGRRRLAGEYRRRCDTVGRTVRVSLAGEVLHGHGHRHHGRGPPGRGRGDVPEDRGRRRRGAPARSGLRAPGASPEARWRPVYDCPTMKVLVTGGAGFIGSNFVRYWVRAAPRRHRGGLRRPHLRREPAQPGRRRGPDHLRPRRRVRRRGSPSRPCGSTTSTPSSTSRPSPTTAWPCSTRAGSSAPTCSGPRRCSRPPATPG